MLSRSWLMVFSMLKHDASRDNTPVTPGTGRKSLRLVITGGGTGGHVFPGVAVGEELSSMCDLSCLWIGTGRPVEKKALQAYEWDYKVLNVQPLKGRGLLDVAGALAHLPFSVISAMRLLRRFRPDVVFGVGGYVSGPVIAAARVFGIKTAIHEQNILPGLANRLASRVVDRIFISMQASRKYFRNSHVECLGNPVRKQIIEQAESDSPQKSNGVMNILILGGSQGASGLNRLASSALKILHQSGCHFSVVHQSGPAEYEELQSFYSEAGMDVSVRDFISDIGVAYSHANLILCRAGATTLAEVTAVGRPVICIPYPHAADGHQVMNARALYDAGAGLYFEEGEVGAVRLASEIEKLISAPDRLLQMTARSRSLGRPDAARKIAESIMELSQADA